MTNRFQKGLNAELFVMLLIFAAFVVLASAVAMETLIIKRLSSRGLEATQGSTAKPTFNTCVNCVTAPKQPRMLKRKRPATESSRTFMASANPKDPSQAGRSLSPHRGDGLGMILIWMESQREFGG
jgi:hypothetical protein